MGLLDSVVGALGQGGGGGQGDLMGVLLKMLTQGEGSGGLGGLAGLVGKLQQGGLGEVASSWISTGPNLPISPEQLGRVLGDDTLAGFAQQLGLSRGDALGQLSQLLPQVVDRLTPDGQLPAGGGLPDLGALGGLLGGLLKR